MSNDKVFERIVVPVATSVVTAVRVAVSVLAPVLLKAQLKGACPFVVAIRVPKVEGQG